MAENKPTGFAEHPFQPHLARAQRENHMESYNIPIPNQPSQTGDDEVYDILEALTVLKRFSSFSQISDSGDNQLNDRNPQRNEEHVQQNEEENPQIIEHPETENPVRNEESHLLLENSHTSPEDNERADPQEVSLDQTMEKLVVNMDKMNSNKLPHKAVSLAVPDNEKRKKFCPPKINNINALTPNIPVNQYNADDKLVRKLSYEHLEYLNDMMLPIYGKNWKNIASLHGWDNEKICHFNYKFKTSAFKELIFCEGFSLYKVKDLLVDLGYCQRKDLIAAYPAQWG